MAKRGEELRALIKKFPPPDDVKKILDSLKAESDRSAALVGTALLEAALERVLQRKMITLTPDLQNAIFQNRGPLADFHSKILIARSLDIINDVMMGELNIMRQVRNVFAHATTPLDFETAEISREIKRSQILQAMQGVDEKMELEGKQGFRSKMTTKSEFTLLIQLLFLFLDSYHQNFGGHPLQSK